MTGSCRIGLELERLVHSTTTETHPSPLLRRDRESLKTESLLQISSSSPSEVPKVPLLSEGFEIGDGEDFRVALEVSD
jgi:hypothetical protein